MRARPRLAILRALVAVLCRLTATYVRHVALAVRVALAALEAR